MFIDRLGSTARLKGIALLVATAIACRGEKQTTLLILGEDSSNLQAMKALAPAFEKQMKQAGRDVSVKFEPVSFEDAGERANNDFRTGAGKYDIVLQYNFSLAEFASKDYVYRVSELAPLVPPQLPRAVASSLFENVWKEVGFYYANERKPDLGEVAVGYPFAANTMLLVYNKAMFEDPVTRAAYSRKTGKELVPPSTWGDFKEIAAFMTDPKRGRCGLALQGKADGSWLYYEWVNVLGGFGGSVMQKERGWAGGAEKKIEIGSAPAIEAARYYASLKPYTCGDFFSVDAPSQRELLLNGNVAMGIVWSDYLFDLVQRAASKKVSFGFLPVPGNKSLIGGGSYYVSRKSAHPALAAQFVMFLLDPSNQVELVRHGLCSPVRDVYANPAVQDVPYIAALGQSLARSTYMLEAGPDADLISARLSNALQRIWKGEDAATVLQAAQKSLQGERSELFAARAASQK